MVRTGGMANFSIRAPVEISIAWRSYACEGPRPGTLTVISVTDTYASPGRLPGAKVRVASPALIVPPSAARISTGPNVVGAPAGGPRALPGPRGADDAGSAVAADRVVDPWEIAVLEELSGAAPELDEPVPDPESAVAPANEVGEAEPDARYVAPDGDAVAVSADVGGDPESSATEPVPVPVSGGELVLEVVTLSMLAVGLVSISAPGAVTVSVPAGSATGAELVSVEAVEEIVAVDDVSVALEVWVPGLLISDGVPLLVVAVLAGVGAGVPGAVVPTVSAGAVGAVAAAAAAAGSGVGAAAAAGSGVGAAAAAGSGVVDGAGGAIVGATGAGAGDEAAVESVGGATVDTAGAGATVAAGAGFVAAATGAAETGADGAETVLEAAGGEVVDAAGAGGGEIVDAAGAGGGEIVAGAGAACAGAAAGAVAVAGAGSGAAAVAAAGPAAGVGCGFGPRAGASGGVGFSACAGFLAEPLLQVEVDVFGVAAAELPAAPVERARGPVELRGATAGGAGGAPTVGAATGSVNGVGAVL
jgi:hypothetical protein